MCGIAGMVRFSGLHQDEHQLGYAMASVLRHRGPDDAGEYHDQFATLGHTRLSIIDLAGGRQPLANEDNSIFVVFNGEIYNYRELSKSLQADGHLFRTHSDTEVIVHLYEERGADFLDEINGMFAIAIWDTKRRQLLLARDRIGIKPLYWYADDQRIAFGSELKAILACRDVRANLDPYALVDYLTFGHVPAPRTIFRDIHKLQPGTRLICTLDGIRTEQWWDIPCCDGETIADLTNESDQLDAFSATIQDATSRRMIADVRLGAFLSSGVDSTLIATAMSRSSAQPIMTHTVGFDEAAWDERDEALMTARQLGTNHDSTLVSADAAEAARYLTRHFDEPFADACAVPMLRLSQAMRQRATVALSGDGGDEMLAGYRRYRFDLAEARMRKLAPSWLRQATAGVAGWLYPQLDWLPRPMRAKRTLQNIACDDITAHLRSTSILGGSLPHMLLDDGLLDETEQYDPYERSRRLFGNYPDASLLNRLLYVDMKTLMVDDILTKVDRMSMAVGLEVRVPLLDHRVVEASARLPMHLKCNRTEGKIALRKTLQRWLPQADHRPKRGFDVPVDNWFRGPLRSFAYDTLTSTSASINAWFDRRTVNRLIEQHMQAKQNIGHVLWMLTMLELWAGEYTQSRWSAPHDHASNVYREAHVLSPSA